MYLSNLFLKKIKIKVNFFPKGHMSLTQSTNKGAYMSLPSPVKGLNSFQIVILQGKNIFVIFYDLFLKITAQSDWPTSDGR
jgi:hypothetical protein